MPTTLCNTNKTASDSDYDAAVQQCSEYYNSANCAEDKGSEPAGSSECVWNDDYAGPVIKCYREDDKGVCKITGLPTDEGDESSGEPSSGEWPAQEAQEQPEQEQPAQEQEQPAQEKQQGLEREEAEQSDRPFPPESPLSLSVASEEHVGIAFRL